MLALLLASPQAVLGARETDTGWEGSLGSGQTTPLAGQWEGIDSQASILRRVLGEQKSLEVEVSHPGTASGPDSSVTTSSAGRHLVSAT